MLALTGAAAIAFSPATPAMVSRPAVRSEAPLMAEGMASRRELFAKAGAALAGMSAVQAASAKAGQFSKIEVFSVVGTPGISSPYQPGGPKAGADATFGYAKSEGPMLATGYEADVTREKAALDVSKKIVRA